MEANSTLGKQFHKLSHIKMPNKLVNMPDRIRKCFGYGQLRPLRPARRQNRPGPYAPGPTSRIHFSSSFFRRKPGSYCAKPTRIRSGRPGQGLAKLIWSGSKPVYRNHVARFLAGRNRPATSFPLSDPVPFFHRRPGYYCAKPARIRFSSG